MSKSYERYLFFQICGHRGQGMDIRTQFFVGDNIQQKRKVRTFGLSERPPSHFLPSVRHPNLPIRQTLRRVLGLLTVMILKRVSGSIFFQRNKFTACKTKHEKELANLLMAFNILKIIHPFQGKEHLRN